MVRHGTPPAPSREAGPNLLKDFGICSRKELGCCLKLVRRVARLPHLPTKVIRIERYVHDQTDSGGESELALRFSKLPLRLGACGEFSDYGVESIGWSPGWTRLAPRAQACGRHPDVQRIRLDRPNETPRRAGPRPRYLQPIICYAG